MGNQLTGDQSSGEILGTVLTKLPEMLQQEQAGPANSRTLTKLRNSKFIRGDEGSIPMDSGSKNQQAILDRSASPSRGLNSDANLSLVRALQNANGSPTPIKEVNQQAMRAPSNKKEERPFNIFKQLFGGQKDSESRLRSSSASHVSMSNSNRKMALLESNIQVSDKKMEHLSKTIESLQNNLRNSESRVFVGEQNSQKLQARCQYLESQIKTLQQEIQNLNSALSQKDSAIYQKNRYIGELQMQTRTLKSQTQLQQSRLNEYAIREQRKDKEIREVSLAKFELNAVRIRLENNIKIMDATLNDRNAKISQLEVALANQTKQMELIKTEGEQLAQTVNSLRSELHDNAMRSESQKQNLHSAIREHLMNIDENQARILQLTHRIDKLYYQQIENQSTIAKLKDQCTQLQSQKAKALQQARQYHSSLELTQLNCQQEKSESHRLRQMVQNVQGEYTHAKRVGQKQIQFLQNKLEEMGREKQRLIEELQVTKVVSIERNRLFERQIIYQLKQENDRLWNKLIEHANQQSDLEAGDNYLKAKAEGRKNVVLPKDKVEEANAPENLPHGRSLLEQRCNNFLKKLEEGDEGRRDQEKSIPTGEASHPEVASLREAVSFYKQKCNELEKMVEAHILLNKNLKGELQKYTNYQLAIQVLKTQLEEAKNKNNQLRAQYVKLKQSVNVGLVKAKIIEAGDLLQEVKKSSGQTSRIGFIPQLVDSCQNTLKHCLLQFQRIENGQ